LNPSDSKPGDGAREVGRDRYGAVEGLGGDERGTELEADLQRAVGVERQHAPRGDRYVGDAQGVGDGAGAARRWRGVRGAATGGEQPCDADGGEQRAPGQLVPEPADARLVRGEEEHAVSL
jgi:hypothetical protein